MPLEQTGRQGLARTSSTITAIHKLNSRRSWIRRAIVFKMQSDWITGRECSLQGVIEQLLDVLALCAESVMAYPFALKSHL
jgi:hypothetical protein